MVFIKQPAPLLDVGKAWSNCCKTAEEEEIGEETVGLPAATEISADAAVAAVSAEVDAIFTLNEEWDWIFLFLAKTAFRFAPHWSVRVLFNTAVFLQSPEGYDLCQMLPLAQTGGLKLFPASLANLIGLL